MVVKDLISPFDNLLGQVYCHDKSRQHLTTPWHFAGVPYSEHSSFTELREFVQVCFQIHYFFMNVFFLSLTFGFGI